MPALRIRTLLLGGVLCISPMTHAVEPPNVVWTSPSDNAAGSMPLGNGQVGINLWVEQNGDVMFYVSHTDAWSEVNRLLKVGKVKLTFDPPLKPGSTFRQTLITREGRAEIQIDDWKLDIFVDAHNPVVWLRGKGVSPRAVSVDLIRLRPERKQLQGQELDSSWTMRGCPNPVWEEADHVIFALPNQYVVHHNKSSIVPLTWKHQGLGHLAALQPDPLLHRAFGMHAPVFDQARRRQFDIPIWVHVDKVQSVSEWWSDLDKLRHASKQTASGAGKRTAAWWKAFWDRSWIEVEAQDRLEIPANAHPIRVAVDSNGQNQFKGHIERVGVWSRLLSGAEIAGHAKTWGDLGAGSDRSLVLQGNMLEHLSSVEQPDFSKGLSVSAWIIPSAEHPIGRMVDKLTAGTSDGFLFDTHPGNALRLIVGSRQLLAENALTPGKRTHVACTIDTANGEMRLYRDGKVLKTLDLGDAGKRITEAYALQRYMNACGSRGQFPVKFNGSIFTVEPESMGFPFNADWRRWGGDYWYQNTRLPYAAMVAAGDYDLMDPIFRLYQSNTKACSARAKEYYGADGVYFPETMTIFGTYSNGDYGWDRKGLEPSNINSPWWQYAWNQGPELLDLMLDRFDHTGDERFLKQQLLPMAKAVLDYFDSRFPRRDGKLAITPAQAVETYWHAVVNDTPTLVGLHDVLGRLLHLPNKLVSKSFADQLTRMRGELVSVPIANGRILPAEQYKDERSNVENPELYALWPFQWAGVGTGRLELARETFRKRIERSNAGWQYDGQCAAVAGLADEAGRSLLDKVGNSNSKYRWPATWGPNYDWLPDQCHGGNIMLTLQHMCLQEVGGKIYVLPAWPEKWNVQFRLKASRKTTVEARYRDGKLVHLGVTPATRRKDVVVGTGDK
ncbi:MAG: hypothetical protein HONBIEJF_01914 [Fimbriimonadaceae bacterium]|nr:hypothetical protein [Fimbriimonadaceae bacterium]